jgi:DNA polymerase I
MKEVKGIEKEEDAPLKYLALDIETVGKDDSKMPEAENDPIVMISIVFEPSFREKKSIVISTRSSDGVDPSDNEKAMLNRLVEIINDYDPDIITGFGRCKSKYVRYDKFANRYRISIVGRVIADSFQIVKRGWNLKRYGLDFVAKELLGEEKGDVKKSEIGTLWRGSAEQLKKLVSYCLKDSILAMNLLLKRDLLDKYVALSKISGSLLNDILGGGEIQRIENYLLREFDKEGYMLPTKLDRGSMENGNGDKKDSLKGGFVLEPKPGLHSMVLVLDFKSMYPSLIRTYNICPTTLAIDGGGDDLIATPSGARFVKKEVRYGIMPRILENLMLERGKVKEQMEHVDEKVKKGLDMKQLALKVMSNAFYGYFGYSRAKIHSLDIAGAITSLGRHTIQETVKTIEDEFGCEVVYGDTDSVMIKVKTDDLEEAERIGKDMSDKITKKLPGVMELEFERILKRFLPLTKKRYMAWSVEKGKDGGWKEDVIMKGIETVRRDWCELTSETMGQIIEIILKHNDVKEAVNYFRGVVKKLLDGEIDIEKLVITKTITKRPEAYVGVQPHVEVIKKMKQRGDLDIPGVGDRIGYVIVKGTQLLSKRAEDPDYVREKGLKLDSQYYISNQMLPPLERIFSAISVDREELLGMGKQMGIAEAINNHNHKHAVMEPVIVSFRDINGFICKRCNRSYRRPPLVGRCECGGSFLFSSPEGPADRIRIS